MKTKQICYKELENPLFQEAAKNAFSGIKLQEKGNFEEAKKNIQEGIDKLNSLTLNGNSEQRRKAMGFRNLFQNFFKDCLIIILWLCYINLKALRLIVLMKSWDLLLKYLIFFIKF